MELCQLISQVTRPPQQAFAWALRLLYLLLLINTAVVLLRGSASPRKALVSQGVVLSLWMITPAAPLGVLPSALALATSALMLKLTRCFPAASPEKSLVGPPPLPKETPPRQD
jgi:hypothetical protein